MKNTLSFQIYGLAFFLAVTLFPSISQAQDKLTLYHMDHIPQAYGLNPGKIPLAKVYVGVPLLSGLRFSGEVDNLQYRNIRDARDRNALDFDFDYLRQTIQERPVDAELGLDLRAISAGFRTGIGFFHVEVSERVFATGRVGTTLLSLFSDLQQERELDSRYDLEQIDLSGSYIRSYAVGYARPLTDRLSVGLRFQYLQGMARVEAINQSLAYLDSPGDDAFTVSGSMLFRGAGLPQLIALNGSFFSPGQSAGSGFAFDLGATYRLTERLELSGSLVNLGRMNWKRNLIQVTLSAESDLADGFSTEDLDAFGEGLEDIYDRLTGEIPSEQGEAFSESTLTRYFLGAHYFLSDRYSVGGVLSGRQKLLGGTSWGGGASFHARFSKLVSASVAYNYTPIKPFGIGFGFTFDPGPVQLYFVSDNLLAVVNYDRSNFASAELGINLVFGKMFRSEVNP